MDFNDFLNTLTQTESKSKFPNNIKNDETSKVNERSSSLKKKGNPSAFFTLQMIRSSHKFFDLNTKMFKK
jgi:hypothetical protein